MIITKTINIFFLLTSIKVYKYTWNYIIDLYHYKTKGESNSEMDCFFSILKSTPLRVLIPAPTGSDKGRKQSSAGLLRFIFPLSFLLYNV